MAGQSIKRLSVAANGRFDLFDGTRALIEGACAHLVYRLPGERDRLISTTESSRNKVLGADDQVELICHCDDDSQRVEIRNIGGNLPEILSLHVLSADVSRGGRVNLGRSSEIAYLEHGASTRKLARGVVAVSLTLDERATVDLEW